MKYLRYFVKHIMDLPMTVYWNFRLFSFATAIKLPILFSRKTKVAQLHRGNIEFRGAVHPYFIKFGVEGVEGVTDIRKSYINLGKKAKVIFEGKTNLSKGISLRSDSGTIKFGKDFYSNCNLSVICADSVSFGDQVLLGWNINVRDCDGHSISVAGQKTPSVKPVVIEDKVWIGAYVDIMKGVVLKQGSVVAYRSCVLKSFDEENILIGGYPACKLKEDVSWEV